MFLVGQVLKPQVIRGEVKVEIITSFPEHFTTLKELNVKSGEKWQAFSIERARVSNRFAFIKFAAINSIEEAERFRYKELYIPEAELPELEEAAFYFHDLLGLSVYNQKGILLGKISDIENYTANDVYKIDSVDGKTLLIPAIKSVIKEVNIAESKMVIDEIEGLFDQRSLI